MYIESLFSSWGRGGGGGELHVDWDLGDWDWELGNWGTGELGNWTCAARLLCGAVREALLYLNERYYTLYFYIYEYIT